MTEINTMPFRRRLYPIPEASQQLGGISRTTVYELAKRGDIALVKIGARSFVTEESLTHYVARLSTQRSPGGDDA